MDSQLSYVLAATAIVAIISIGIFRLFLGPPAVPKAKLEQFKLPASFPEPAKYVKDLAAALPTSVILAQDLAEFGPAMKVWFSAQNRDIIPACIVRPRNAQELSTAMKHIRREHAVRAADPSATEKGLFAVRAGGANPATGISGVENGVMIDLVRMNHVVPSKDGTSVAVGAGAYWRDVYKALEGTGLGVCGGRSSPVGVGGLTLQGGISFWSPKYGFVCSNVISYQVVVADGSISTASENENADLWRALKGGGNNFGIVTEFTLRAFPAPEQIWAGSWVTFGFQSKNTIKAFYEHTRRSASASGFDEHAATPILTSSWLQDQGIIANWIHMAHTEPSPDGDWPEYWKKSPFRSLWRIQNKSKNSTLREAVMDLGSLSTLDERNVYGTTTVTNDLPTLLAVDKIFRDLIPSTKHVKNSRFIYIMQAVLPQWADKGSPNMLGLEGLKEPIIIVSFAVNWKTAEHDTLMRGTTGRCIDKIEELAEAKGTGHPYRFSNYSSEWQKPLHGYGAENMRFMQGVSKKYDPEGLFQTGCLGGFKLDKSEK